MTALRRVALAFPIALPHMERAMRGILDYARVHGPWRFDINVEPSVVPMRSLRSFHGDGVIAVVPSAAEEARAAQLRVPVVNLSSAVARPRLPAVVLDNRAAGALAADHLLKRGFRHFAYYGARDVHYGRERGAGFAAAAEAAGATCAQFLYPSSGEGQMRAPWVWNSTPLVRWLRGLDKPLGVFAVQDYRARMVIEACATAELRVPGDVAVVGLHNDAVVCELSAVPLTSVVYPGHEMGERAAELLDHLMNGGEAPPSPIVIPPRELIPRQSTDAVAVSDPAVVAATRLMSERIDRPISIESVADHVGLSRRWLERRFQAVLDVTPYAYLSRIRVDRAKEMLANSAHRAPLAEVARRCGLGDARHLNEVFHRTTGVTPNQFRARYGSAR